MTEDSDVKTLPTGLKTAEEVASTCYVSAQKLLSYAEQGFCPHWKIDGKIFFQRDKVRAWVKSNLAFQSPGLPLRLTVLVVESPRADVQEVPTAIRWVTPLFDGRKAFDASVAEGKRSGVYFLCLRDEVVYVGQAHSLCGRVGQHVGVKQFDRWFYVPVPREHLDDVEGAMTRLLRPRLCFSTRGHLCTPGGDHNMLGLDEIILQRFKVS